jgi:hypothetical protein
MIYVWITLLILAAPVGAWLGAKLADLTYDITTKTEK